MHFKGRMNDLHRAEQTQVTEAHQLEMGILKAFHADHNRYVELKICGRIIMNLCERQPAVGGQMCV